MRKRNTTKKHKFKKVKIAILYNPKVKKYDFGEGHPFRGQRYEMFMEFFEGRFPQVLFERIKPEPAVMKFWS